MITEPKAGNTVYFFYYDYDKGRQSVAKATVIENDCLKVPAPRDIYVQTAKNLNPFIIRLDTAYNSLDEMRDYINSMHEEKIKIYSSKVRRLQVMVLDDLKRL